MSSSALLWQGPRGMLCIQGVVLIAGMDILQFKGMSRVLEHVHRWVEGKFYAVAQQLYGDVSDPASTKAKLIEVGNHTSTIT